MKNDYFIETEEETKARWAKFAALTDEEINAAIAEDEDSQTPEHGAGVWLSGWHSNSQNEDIILPLSVDRQTVSFITSRHLDYQTFLSGVLKAYIAGQGGDVAS